METKFTWQTVLATAAKDTWLYFRGAKLKAAIISATWVTLGGAMVFGYYAVRYGRSFGESAVSEVFKEWFFAVLAVGALWVFAIFLWKLWMAPVRLIGAALDAMEDRIKKQEWSIHQEKIAREHFVEGWTSKLNFESKRVDNMGAPLGLIGPLSLRVVELEKLLAEAKARDADRG